MSNNLVETISVTFRITVPESNHLYKDLVASDNASYLMKSSLSNVIHYGGYVQEALNKMMAYKDGTIPETATIIELVKPEDEDF